MSTRTYLSIVTDSAALYPTRAIFKIPTAPASGSELHAWKDVTYAQFVEDIELYAKFWGHKLTPRARSSYPGLLTKGLVSATNEVEVDVSRMQDEMSELNFRSI